MHEQEKRRPIQTIRLGRIKAVIWVNEGDNGSWYSTQVYRLYKDTQDQWRQSDSFSRDDLLLLCKVLDEAHSWIYQNPLLPRINDEAEGPADDTPEDFVG